MASPASKRTVGDLGWDMAVLRREAYHGWRVAVTGAAVRKVGRTRAVLGFPLGTTRTPACGVRMKPISLVRSALQGDPRGPGIGVQMSARRDVAADCRCDGCPRRESVHPWRLSTGNPPIAVCNSISTARRRGRQVAPVTAAQTT